MASMFNKLRKKKSKKTVLRSSSVIASTPTVYDTLFNCYNFLSSNEYFESALGILAPLLLKCVDTKNFSTIINEIEKRFPLGISIQAKDFLILLEEKKRLLPIDETSIEECLMINRLISFIKKDEKRFEETLSQVRHEMETRLINNNHNQEIDYIKAFNEQKAAQDRRRLFYFTHHEVNEPLNLVTLQDNVTQQLITLIDSKIKNSSIAQKYHLETIENLLNNSFMIIVQPQFNKIPVLISKRKAPGFYEMKISVIVVSLLSNFMKIHPEIIEFKDIEVDLLPVSDFYKLSETNKLFWDVCHLQFKSTDTTRIFHIIKLSSMVIEQTSRHDTHVHFANAKHTLKFSLNLHINLNQYKYTKNFTIVLETMPFAITQINDHTPQLLTKILLDDIRRFCDSKPIKIEHIWYFLRRYFICRVGTIPHANQETYVLQELNRALNSRMCFSTLEDIYMDFLVPYVNQVEYMVKHPILAMLYSDGLFLGTCDSARVAEIMKRPSDENIPKIALRFNSIRIDYDAINEQSVFYRNIRCEKCAVRVDIYNDRKKVIKYRTFDRSMLISGVCKVIFKALLSNHSHIRILYKFNSGNDINYQSFEKLTEYYDFRLRELSKGEDKYKLITDFDRNYRDQESEDSVFEDDDDDDCHSDNSRLTDSSVQNSVVSELTLLINQSTLASDELSTLDCTTDVALKFCRPTTGLFKSRSSLYGSTSTEENDILHFSMHAENTTSEEQTPVESFDVFSNRMDCFVPSYPISSNSTYSSLLKQMSNCQIIYLSKNSCSTSDDTETSMDKYQCISNILSSTEKLIYLIISMDLAKTVIPLIHDHICVESIYIKGNTNSVENTTWKYSFSKIRGTWLSMKQIVHENEEDLLLLKYPCTHWYNPNLTKNISFVRDNLPYIVILTKGNSVPLHLPEDSTKIYKFNTVHDYHTFMTTEKSLETFLIITDDFISDTEKLISYDTIQRTYLYLTNNKSNAKHGKISGSFNHEQDLRQQLMTDICFFRQLLPISTSRIILAKLEHDNLSMLNEEKTIMLIIQFYFTILNQFCSDPNIPEEISEHIEKSNNNLSHDLYVNNVQLTLCIDQLIQQFDSNTLLEAASLYGFINEYYESSMKKICPNSMTVYRAQLVSADDLKKIQDHKNSLFTIPTLIFASRSYLSSKTICRQAYQNNLTTILFEINIPKQTALAYINDDIIIFPLATVFTIKSVEIAPDNICHVRMQSDASTMDLITKQIDDSMRARITWLTFGNYLARIKQFDEAEKYLIYLRDLSSLDSRQRAAIYNNLGLVYSSVAGKSEESWDYLQKAQYLLGDNNSDIQKNESNVIEKLEQYVRLAEQYENENDYLYACFFYEKACQLTNDSSLRTKYQLKIKTLNNKF